MMNAQIAQSLVIGTMLLVTNSIALILAGATQALVAKKLGDTTAEEAGFLTLDPLAHIDILSITFLVLYGFGWINKVPINPHNITGPFRSLKCIVLYASATFCAFLFAVITAIIFLNFFVIESLLPGLALFFGNTGSFSTFAAFYPLRSSWFVVIALFLLAYICANIFVATFTSIVNGFRCITMLIMDEDATTLYSHQPLLNLIPLFGIIFYFGKIRSIVIYSLFSVIHMIFSFLGA
jgi:hypothetical protein